MPRSFVKESRIRMKFRPSSPGGVPGMEIYVSFDFRAFEKLRGYFRDIDRRMDDLKPWFRKVAVPTLRAAHRMHFGRPFGAYGGVASDWSKPYSKRYANWKIGLYRHLVLGRLERDQPLRRSLTSQTQYSIVQFDSIGSGSDKRKAILRFGTQVKSVKAEDGTGSRGYGYAVTMQRGAKTNLGRRFGDGPHRKKRKSERRGKSHIPARPPVIRKYPRHLTDDLAVSAGLYVLFERIVPVRP